MKKFLMNMSAIVLAVCYCMSIIGFDVHTCMSSGRTFIATFADGVACADIHPEHHCCEMPCCSSGCHDESAEEHHEHSQEEVDVMECCSDEYHVILLSGCRNEDNSDFSYSFLDSVSSLVQEIPVLCIADARLFAESHKFREPDSGNIPPRDINASFGFWRI